MGVCVHTCFRGPGMKTSDILLQFRVTVGAEDKLTLWQETFCFGRGCSLNDRVFLSITQRVRRTDVLISTPSSTQPSRDLCVHVRAWHKHMLSVGLAPSHDGALHPIRLQGISWPLSSLHSHTVTVKQFWMSKFWIVRQSHAEIQVLRGGKWRMQKGRKEFVRPSRD